MTDAACRPTGCAGLLVSLRRIFLSNATMKLIASRIILTATVTLCAVAAVWLAGKHGGQCAPLGPSAAFGRADEPAENPVAKSMPPGEAPKNHPGKPPPLQIDKGAPLLLEEPPQSPQRKAFAQNEACYVCHENYREESFADYHARAEVGCIKCHGESVAHRGDESNLTPPEIMFPPEAIEKNCKACHDTHDAPAAKVIALWLERCQNRSSPKELLCTDCHGEHRLAVRTIVWDKRTGKLLRKPQQFGNADSRAE